MNKKEELIDNLEDDPELVKIDKMLTAEYNKYVNKINKRKYIKNSTLVGAHSRFKQKLFDKYDTPARNKLKEVLGDYIEDNPNKYAQDFIIKSDKCKYKYLEVQVCSTWSGGSKYPYEKVWIFERKSVYNYDSSTLFITLSRDLKEGYLFDIDSIKGIKPRRMKKYSREFVYDIPWHRVLKVHTCVLDRETIELY